MWMNCLLYCLVLLSYCCYMLFLSFEGVLVWNSDSYVPIVGLCFMNTVLVATVVVERSIWKSEMIAGAVGELVRSGDTDQI